MLVASSSSSSSSSRGRMRRRQRRRQHLRASAARARLAPAGPAAATTITASVVLVVLARRCSPRVPLSPSAPSACSSASSVPVDPAAEVESVFLQVRFDVEEREPVDAHPPEDRRRRGRRGASQGVEGPEEEGVELWGPAEAGLVAWCFGVVGGGGGRRRKRKEKEVSGKKGLEKRNRASANEKTEREKAPIAPSSEQASEPCRKRPALSRACDEERRKQREEGPRKILFSA